MRTPSYSLKVNLLDLIPIIFIGGGVGLMVFASKYLEPQATVLRIVSFACGAIGAAWGIYTAGYCMSVYSNLWIERRLRAEVECRPDRLVDPRSPDAIFVSIIPRKSFSQVRLTMSSDLLLVRIDDQHGAVLLEGDTNRYHIPANAIEHCEAECLFHPADVGHQNQLWMVKLIVRSSDGISELLLSVGLTGWLPRTNSRRRKTAEATCDRIDSIRAGTNATRNDVGSDR